MKCATHLEIETNLRCGKCGKPICPKCLVHTPVGARCVTCARLYKLPTYQVPSRYYLRAIGAALGAAFLSGIVWATLSRLVPPLMGLLIVPGIGWGVGEVVSLAVNRKRGWGLAAVAAAGVMLSFLVAIVLPDGRVPVGLIGVSLNLVAVGVGIFVAVSRLR